MWPRVESPKIFRQCRVEPKTLIRLDTDHGRFYHEEGKSVFCPSATTVLSYLDDGNWLEEWKSKVGEEKSAKISREATTKGTGLHWLCETYLSNNDINVELRKSLSVITQRFLNLVPTLNRIDAVIGVELMMISYEWNIAGTTDLVAYLDGSLEIVDYKTSKRIKSKEDIESYFVQLCAYSKMFHECYGHKIKYGRIIMSVENKKEPLIFRELLDNWEHKLLEAKLRYEKEAKGFKTETI